MKLRFALLVTSFCMSLCLVLVENALAQQVNITVKDASFKSVVQSIRKQTGYSFILQDELVRTANPVSLSINNRALSEVLPLLFANQPFGYKLSGKIISLTAKGEIPESSALVQREVRGKVTDSTGNPLSNVTVVEPISGIHAVTNREGNYAIRVGSGASLLQFRLLGFEMVERNIDATLINVVMQKEFREIDEVDVVHTGYQSLPRERATGSFAGVSNNLFNQRAGSQVLQRLEGNVPGLLFNKNTVASNRGGIDINLRGHTTLFANDQPLIVVDNFPYDGPLTNINPNDVESVTVLKDAAASSIWGVKSGNGVIVITTKKGKLNQENRVEANVNVSIGNRPDLYYAPLLGISSSDYIDLEIDNFYKGYYNTQLNNTSTFPAVSPVVHILDQIKRGSLDSLEGYGRIGNLRYNNYREDMKEYFYRKSVNQQYSVNMSGGTDKANYYFSVGHDENSANEVGNENARTTIGLQVGVKPIHRLTITGGTNLTFSSDNVNSVISDLSSLAFPFTPYTDLVDNATGEALPVARKNPAFVDTIGGGQLLDWNYRPFDEIRNARNTQRQIHNRFNASAKYELIESLSVSAQYQLERASTRSENYFGQETYYARDLINSFTQLNSEDKNPVPMGGILNERNAQLTSHRGRIQLNFDKKIGALHQVTALAGGEISESVTRSKSNTIYGYNPENETFINVDYTTSWPQIPRGSKVIPNNIGSTLFTDRYLSYFGNAGYMFKGRYLLSISGRIDKSNLFGVRTNQKAVPLFSTGLAWTFSQEDFYKAVWLPYGRLRITFGANGNIDKSAAAVTTFQAISRGWFYGTPFAEIDNPGNPELRWEKIKTLNAGLDFGFRNQRLTGSVEYYIKSGKDLFGFSRLPGSTGLPSYYGNTSSVKTRGIDINLSSLNVNQRDFRWATNLMFSYAKDIVTAYHLDISAGSLVTGLRPDVIQPIEGNSLFGVYSYKWGGLQPGTGDPQGYVDGEISTDYTKIRASTTVDDLVYHGSARPVTFGSLRNTLSYKQLSLSFNMLFKANYYFIRSTVENGLLYQSLFVHSDYYKRWQQPGDELTTDIPAMQPMPVNSARSSFYTVTEAFVERGDHIRLQDISLRYDWDIAALTKGKVSSIRFYSFLNNVAILWRANDEGIDPDLFARSYPEPLSISFGVNAKF